MCARATRAACRPRRPRATRRHPTRRRPSAVARAAAGRQALERDRRLAGRAETEARQPPTRFARVTRTSMRTLARARGAQRARASSRWRGECGGTARTDNCGPLSGSRSSSRGNLRATNTTLRVPLPTSTQRCESEPRIGGNGSIRVSQFSSTALPITSRAPGRIAASPSLQSCGRRSRRGHGRGRWRRRRCSPRRRRCRRSRRRRGGSPGSRRCNRPDGGRRRGRRRLRLLAGGAGVVVVGDRRVLAGVAVDPLRPAVAGDDVVVAGTAVEGVEAAAAEQAVGAVLALEDDVERHRRADRGDVIAVAEVQDDRPRRAELAAETLCSDNVQLLSSTPSGTSLKRVKSRPSAVSMAAILSWSPAKLL